MKKIVLLKLLHAREAFFNPMTTVHPYRMVDSTTQVDWSNWGMTYSYGEYDSYSNNQYEDWWKNNGGQNRYLITTPFRDVYATTEGYNWNRPKKIERVTSFESFEATTAPSLVQVFIFIIQSLISSRRENVSERTQA